MSHKQLLASVFTDVLDAVTPQSLIASRCDFTAGVLSVNGSQYDLTGYRHVHVFGSGKAVIPMAEAIHDLLGDRIDSTYLVGPYDANLDLPNTTYRRGSHPIPTESSLDAAAQLRDRLAACGEDDFFVYLLSGGTSALVELPVDLITLADFGKTTEAMIRGGMPIEAMNAVRKHISQVKGGRLGNVTPARGVVVVLSDVVDDDLSTIGSAPLYCDHTTFRDALNVLEKFRVLDDLPDVVRGYLDDGASGKHPETPDDEPEHIDHHVIGSNAVVKMNVKQLLSERSNLPVTVIDQSIDADVLIVVQQLTDLIAATTVPTIYVLGGETTVTVIGTGKGGRNQHLALHMVQALTSSPEVTFLSAATDGIDGNSAAAGALIDSHSRAGALSRGADPQLYLTDYDSNSFFSKTGEVLEPGPTHNNLLDIVMMIVEPISGAHHG